MRKTNSRSLLCIVAVALLVGACGGAPPKDIVLEGQLIATDNINPNRQGRASPVKVVIFHLRSADAFQSLDFFNLVNPDSGAIDADVIQRIDMQVQPGDTLSIAGEFDPETTHIGVLAAFRDIDNADWRTVLPLPEKSLTEKLNPFADKRLVVRIDGLAITAAVEE